MLRISLLGCGRCVLSAASSLCNFSAIHVSFDFGDQFVVTSTDTFRVRNFFYPSLQQRVLPSFFIFGTALLHGHCLYVVLFTPRHCFLLHSVQVQQQGMMVR